MSGRLFFADTMHALIEAEEREARRLSSARAYVADCERIRSESLPRGEAIPSAFHKANEGLCAVARWG
jgi:hypothetical protein